MASGENEDIELLINESDSDDIDEQLELATDISDSDDDEEEDPDFLINKELSKLSITKKSRPRVGKGDAVGVQTIAPEIDYEDQKSFDAVEKIVNAGDVEKLKVDQCKVYLRKYGLRLTGVKDILIQRIKEHQEIIKGNGESRYPPSTFVLNCKGDACAGDVVMFEQKVYEMFSIASRSATGPPIGTRVVAGRIVKESYGAAKQQHTFTIEVLWSKGEKPLPPLHPLLIKGRNLYRLKTMRQRWEDEEERQKKLTEKHNRGCVARSNREARIQVKEMRKKLNANRVPRTGSQNGKLEEDGRKNFQSISVNLGNCSSHFNGQPSFQNANQEQKFQQMMPSLSKAPPCSRPTFPSNSFVPPLKTRQNAECREATLPSNLMVPPVNVHQRQPLTTMNYNYDRQYANHKPSKIEYSINSIPLHMKSRHEQRNQFQRAGPVDHQKKLCPYYPQGRCYYGDNCKYLHDENIRNPSYH